MQFKIALFALFATVAIASPQLDGSDAADIEATTTTPSIPAVARPQGPIQSGPSCCSHTPGVCKASCCPGGCPGIGAKFKLL